ncbi:UxaA family hydrolase [Intestinimonas sp. UBA1698]|uniref:UxaA family hydrolase n=1 Tax=Intestinimonas sp. UBA1698 TaxID=1946651 RepID=UPI002579F908|nr:altronate dehydratase family protein [Intestinimonas sp. UBA1698]
MNLIRIHPLDNVAVALEDIPAGETVTAGGSTVTARQAIPRGHKLALAAVPAGARIIKYGCTIGLAKADIAPGDWVHVHNVRTGLSEDGVYAYHPRVGALPPVPPRTFQGYRRPDGRAAIRNELWVLPTVGCVNAIAQALVRENQHLTGGTVEGLYAFPHPFGCSQMGEDHAQTRKLLAALARHPNAGGVLVLGLGCENLTMEQFQAELGPHDKNRVRFLVCQDVEDELAAGAALLKELADYAGTFRREPISASELVVGLKCGGSDGLSGITANPAVGRFSDRLIALGGSTVLTEVPEMFGAESILFDRCKDQAVFDKAVQMVEAFKRYFIRHGQVVYENPSPGNKAGGITTLEDKSCGCVQKGGSARIVDVLGYGEAVTRRGLNLLSGPGNDLVSTTALTAAGAHLILFTTGRGTPFGAPAPTVKISSNTALFQKKGSWIDFNAGTVAEGETLDAVGDRLLDLVLEAASGSPTKTELHGAREIAIFKDGVVL